MLEWKEEYALGIPEIDSQHKKLVEIGSQIGELLADQNRDDYFDDIMELLTEMQNYTVEHFKYEESLFDEKNYIDADNHKFEHKLFVRKIKIYLEDFEKIDSNQQGTLIELLNFISDWLIKHIIVTDKKYVEVLKK